jgi:hypothetical protein
MKDPGAAGHTGGPSASEPTSMSTAVQRPSGDKAPPTVATRRHAQVSRSSGHSILGLDRPNLETLAFVAALFAGMALRVLELLGPGGGISSDEAVIYLMARHAQHGHLQAFYWSQGYGGSLLPDLTGLVFHVTGSHVLVMQLVEVATYLAATLVLRQLVCRIAGRRAGDLTAALFWLAPLSVLISVHDPIYVVMALLLAFTALLAVVEYRGRAWIALVAGIALGLGWWTTPFVLLLVWPAAILVWLARSRPTHLLLVAAGFLAGSLPWWWNNLNSGFESLQRVPATGTFADRLGAATTQLLAAGLNPSRGQWQSIADLVGAATMVVLGAALVWAVQRRRWALAAAFVTGLAWPVFVAFGAPLVVPSALRYVVFLLPILALVVAMPLVRVYLPVIAAVLAGTVVCFGAAQLTPLPHNPRNNPGLAEVADYLTSSHRTRVFADYSISYVLTAQTQEQITAEAVIPSRNLQYARLAQRAFTSVVVWAGRANDAALRPSAAHRVQFGPYAVYLYRSQVALPALGVE